ncbi:MAG: peptide deformylase [Patescibacteria group bacterium]|nr:peptide deformylase [Patescibacteria group bacterium]
MVLPIKKFPDKVLRAPTQKVAFPLSEEMKKLTLDMIDTVKAADGIGLAAPQVGKSVKLVVINLEKSGLELFPLYNPKILKRGFKKVEIEEGCLSLPGIFGMVKRPKKIKVEAQNMKGEKVVFEDDGWVSRVVQHEVDHIDNVLIIDLIKKYTQGEDLVKAWKKQKLF